MIIKIFTLGTRAFSSRAPIQNANVPQYKMRFMSNLPRTSLQMFSFIPRKSKETGWNQRTGISPIQNFTGSPIFKVCVPVWGLENTVFIISKIIQQ